MVPPDRVGVARKLQLGVTLKPTASAAGGFELDLRTPDAHKTAALFGPSTTPVPAAACALLRVWLAEAGSKNARAQRGLWDGCGAGGLRASLPASQTLMVLSSDPETMVLPSGEKATEST